MIEEEEIYIHKNKENISIYTYIKEDNKSNKVEVLEKDLYKYENSIKLIKELDLNYISNEYGNILFLFNSTIKTGQYIVKMNNEEKFKWEYNIVDSETFDNNWYYIEAK